MFLRSFILIFFMLSIASADQSKMLPLPLEKLETPVELQCGLNVVEWRSTKKLDQAKLNYLCNKGVNYFPKFLAKNNIKKEHDLPFVWRASFIKGGSCFRCLNDLKHRFSERTIKYSLSGYTDYNIGYIFVDIENKDFDTIFAHELYHALSSYYNVLFSESEDEKLARDFTRDLGLGI